MTYEEAVQTIPTGLYRHFKGNEYEVIGIARHSEDISPMVVYKALYGDYGIWVRPAEMWNETIERDGKIVQRFTRMSNRKTIPLSVIVTAIEETTEDWEQYYNTVTGEVQGIPDHNNYYVDHSEFQEVAEKIDESDDYLRLPSQRELNEYDIMERFAVELDSETLLRALRGRKPFRTFKDRAAQIGLIKAYYTFRSAAYSEIAREWCRENAVPFTE